MGHWGTGIFQDDFACDLRSLYTELVSLKFTSQAILAELQRFSGGDDGRDGSTFWIALALLQHKLGPLDEDVKRQALDLIDSGRALQDWADLSGKGDSSIPSRNQALLKARSTILSVPPKQKSPRPSKELLARIDRSYPDFPWKQGALYAYRLSTDEYVVLAAVRVYEVALQQHYARKGDGFVPVEMPPFFQPQLLLLDYRNSRPPSGRELKSMKPFVKPIPARDRKDWLKVVDETHAMHLASAKESFPEFERKNRERHATRTDEEFRDHYQWWVGWSRKQAKLYSDREHALERYFYVLLQIDARQRIPVDRLTDLGTARHFDYENKSTPASWEDLENYLISKKSLTKNTCWVWPAAE